MHKICRKKKPLEWKRLTNSGIADQSVLNLLLTEYADYYSQLMRLMTKFGLLVQLQSSDRPNVGPPASESNKYLVPALLPCSRQRSVTWSDLPYSTCYIVCTTCKELEQFTAISEEDLKLYGFLPQGLFERLLGKAVTWVRKVDSLNAYYK